MGADFRYRNLGILGYTSYTGFATRDDAYDVIIIHTAATHDAIIMLGTCYF